MKTHNLDRSHALDATKGRRNTNRAGSRGLTIRDGTTEASPIVDITFVGATVTEDEDTNTAVVTVGTGAGSSTPLVNAPITAALSNPPTQAELETAVGSPASEVAGQAYVLVDDDTGLRYDVTSDGLAFGYVPVVEPTSAAVEIAAVTGKFNDLQSAHAAVEYNGYVYFGDLTVGDDVEVKVWSRASRSIVGTQTLHLNIGDDNIGSDPIPPPDDHDAPSVMVSDTSHKLMVAYSGHGGPTCYLSISDSSLDDDPDLSDGFTELDLGSSIGATDYTYLILHQLGSTKYILFRSFIGTGSPHANAEWSFTRSTDDGATWSANVPLALEPSKGLYWQVWKSSETRLDFMCSDHGPFSASGPVSLFHFSMDDAEQIYQTDGTEITATWPIATASMTPVWTTTSVDERGAQHEIRTDADGNPYGVFAVYNAVSPEDADYYWTRWNGTFWERTYLATNGTAGSRATIRLSPLSTNVAYLTREVSGIAEVYRYVTLDEGLTFTGEAITEESAEHNQDLVVVDNASPDMEMLWTYGDWPTSAGTWGVGAGGGLAGAGELTRSIALDGDALGDGLVETIERRGTDGIWYKSRDLGVTWEALASGENPAAGLLTVDAGSPTYDASGDDLVVTFASDYGYDADGPYYDSTGAATGEEALLAIDPSSGELVVIPYVP